jgi:hypothetical protein
MTTIVEVYIIIDMNTCNYDHDSIKQVYGLCMCPSFYVDDKKEEHILFIYLKENIIDMLN